ncbi:UDP-N-acetylmuramoyl-L-alanyl-D-glutamate--2,6-diaminopimelate ligase [Oscillospiraceae bacterium HV4-5-C5C]|nr:UDP-N-acetylmuramoyl-L-alanyl-D-glutamate--2,6-diaminopimelate ligase [Oscillospiraceae bacterium HV4-5-C5C]
MKLSALFEDQSLPPLEIHAIYTDSRKVTPGSLFIAVRGLTVDGHRFAGQAVQHGAVALLLAHPLPELKVVQIIRPQPEGLVGALCAALYQTATNGLQYIGVTGTDGKTTTTRLLAHILNHCGRVAGYIGTSGIDYPGYISHHDENTTPEAALLHQTFSRMKTAGVTQVVMEVSSHALDQHRVDGIPYQTAVFTNFARDHIDYHGSVENYYEAKLKLFRGLSPSATAVLNADDQKVLQAATATRAAVLTFGTSGQADYRGEAYQDTPDGLSFMLVCPQGTFQVSTGIHGRFNMLNCLAALACCQSLKLPLQEAVASLADFKGAPGRQEAVDLGQDFKVYSDFAHTVQGVEAVLRWVSSVPHHKLWTVVACSARRDEAKRPLIGQLVCRYSDHPVFTTDMLYDENPRQIIAEMGQGLEPDQYLTIINRFEAIRYCIDQAEPNDIIIVLGNGDYLSLPIGDKNIYYNEVELMKLCISERMARQEYRRLTPEADVPAERRDK